MLYTPPYFSFDCALYYFILFYFLLVSVGAGQKCRALATLLCPSPHPSLPPSCCNYANFVPPTEAWEARRSTTTRERERETKQKNGKSGNEMFFTHECERMHLSPECGEGAWHDDKAAKGTKLGGHWKFFLRLMETGLLLLGCSVQRCSWSWSRGKCGKFMETIFRC